MLVTLRRSPLAVALLGTVAVGLALPLPARAADRPADRTAWSQATLDAAQMSREDADRAFAAPPVEGSAGRDDTRVDESALRYYASQHATARVEAEIRRLRALYPGWEPPADLYRPAADEQALWDLYGKDQIDQLKLEIERRTARQPGWKPSQDMIAKLRRKELRIDLIKASDAADWAKVQKIAERDPMLIGADDLEITWRIAEAAAKTGGRDRALELYRLALAGARTAEERSGTVRKALAAMGADAAGPLLADERIGPDGKGEFEPLRVDVARAALGDWLKGDAAKPLPQADLDRLTKATAAADGTPGDAALLGWIDHRRKAWASARKWFDLAGTRGAGPKAVLGGVLVREASGAHDEALALATTATDDAEVAALYLDLMASDLTRPGRGTVPAERIARFAEITQKLESGDAAQALGWYAYGARQTRAAAAWFAKAMAWRPSVKSAEGHLLALKALGERRDFARLETDYRGRFPDLPALRFEDPAQRVVVKTEPAPKRACPALLADRAAGRAGSPADALAAGWCLMDIKRAEEAAVAFQTARTGDPRLGSEAAYGQALAHLRSGRTDDAARVATSGGLTQARRDEIGRIVLAQQAIARFDREDWSGALDALDRRRAHADEPRDLTAMRAWSLYHLGRNPEAFELFTLLDRQLSTQESRAGLAATGPRPFRRS
jgi:hypothetical protein